MKLLGKMKNMSFTLWKKINGLFGRPNVRAKYSMGAPLHWGSLASAVSWRMQGHESFHWRRQHPQRPTDKTGPALQRTDVRQGKPKCWEDGGKRWLERRLDRDLYQLKISYFKWNAIESLTGASKLLASLGHTGRRRVVLGHTWNMQTLTNTDEQ